MKPFSVHNFTWNLKMLHIFHHLLAWHFFTSHHVKNGRLLFHWKMYAMLHLGGQIESRTFFFSSVIFFFIRFYFLLCMVSRMLEICYWVGDLNYCTHFMFTKQTIFWQYFENNLSFFRLFGAVKILNCS